MNDFEDLNFDASQVEPDARFTPLPAGDYDQFTEIPMATEDCADHVLYAVDRIIDLCREIRRELEAEAIENLFLGPQCDR